MDLTHNLRELRIENGFTQRELAQQLNLSPNIICEWEKGRCSPGIEALKKLSSIFECSIDFLVGNSDDLGNIVINTEKQTAELSPDGQELLEIFNSLEREHRAQILEYARYFAQRAHPQIYKRNKNA
jgi:transcriptional regulator with XRE-family HTH domain